MITCRNPNAFLNTLPAEILHYIASHLTQCDLLSLNRTSKALHRSTTPHLYRHVTISSYGQLRTLAETVSANRHITEYARRITWEDQIVPFWGESEARLLQFRRCLGTPWTNLKVLIMDKRLMEAEDALVIKRLATNISNAVLVQPQLEHCM